MRYTLNDPVGYPLKRAILSAPSNPRILVVDDHSIVREGLLVLLERVLEFRIVGCAATGEEAIVGARHLKPSVIIMDLALPVLNGIEATRCILNESPDIHVIALSAHRGIAHVTRALRAGVRGYVVKDAASCELIQAVKTVAAGRRYVSASVAKLLGDAALEDPMPPSPIERLSIREREVLRRIVAGATSSDIARHLCLSRKTVDTYRARLMVKLGVTNRSALIRLALEHELTLF